MRCFDGDIRACANRNSHICLRKSGAIIDTITNHRYSTLLFVFLLLEFVYFIAFVLW
jgi:hypothetical protein